MQKAIKTLADMAPEEEAKMDVDGDAEEKSSKKDKKKKRKSLAADETVCSTYSHTDASWKNPDDLCFP